MLHPRLPGARPEPVAPAPPRTAVSALLLVPLLVVGALATPAPRMLAAPLAAQEGGADGGGEPGKGLPLEPARWVEFTAEEGTWTSLDVSPDGRTIVFDLLGDLYTIPIEGGEATRITEGIAHDMQPRFSPDGGHIVFVSDRSGDDNLWIARPDGTDLRQLTRDGGVVNSFLSPEWTPDGRFIVVARGTLEGGLEKLWLYHRDGGTGIELTEGPPGLRFQGPAFGPDGRYVWYAQRNGAWTYNAVFPEYQIGVYDRETGTRTTMSSRYGSAFRPALSPDGRWLTYGTRHDTETGLVLRELETGEERWLAHPIQRDDQESIANMDVLPGYAFTPDSRAVVISYGGRIWRVPVDGSEARPIPYRVEARVAVGPEVHFEYPIPDEPTFTARQIRDAVPSPDGSRIAFSALDRLYVMELPDGTPRRLTRAEVGEHQPAWSPDGASVAYVTWDDAEGRVMRVAAGGGTPRPVSAAPAYYQRPAWSPDGRRIVAMRADARNLREAVDPFVGDGLGAEFVWFPAGGGPATVIGPTEGRSFPHFTEDPDRIYSYGFVPEGGDRPAAVALVSTRWDGSDLKRHLRVTWRLPVLARTWELRPGSDLPMPRDFSRPAWEEAAALDPAAPWAAALRERNGTSGGGGLATGAAAEGRSGAGSGGEVGHGGGVGGGVRAQVRSHDRLREGGPPEVPVSLVLMAPRGDLALARVNNDLYTVTVPVTGGPVPTVMVSKPDSAQMPVRKLTDIGGEFPAWGADGRTVHWSLGNAFVTYRLDRAEEVEDSLRRAGDGEAGDGGQKAPGTPGGGRDAAGGEAKRGTGGAAAGRGPAADGRAREPAYRPEELRVRIEVARDIPRGTVVLRGARVVTMRGDEVIENADLVVRDHRILSVGAAGSAPTDAEVLDVSGTTIVPGFVDTHAHMWNLWGLHWSRPWIYLANLAYGVTTTRDPQTATTDVLTYADLVRAGRMPGPRVYSTGPGVFWREGIRDLDHARDVLRRYSDYYDTKTFKMYMSGNRRQRQLLIMAARELGLMPTTEGGLDYRLDMTHAMDGYPGIEHSLPIVPAYRDVVELFTTSGTVNTPTLLVSYGGPWAENWFYTNEDLVDDRKLARFTPPEELDAKIRRRNPGPGPGGWFMEEEYAFRKHAAWLRELVEAGGRTGVGSHGQLQGLGYHWELWTLQSGGMSEHDALRAATLMGAEAIGLGGDLGSLEPGKLADLLVLEENPLEDIRHTNTIRFVMKNGRLYDGDTLDELWPRQRPAPDEPWRHTRPERTAVHGDEGEVR